MLPVPVEQLVGQMVGKYRIVNMLGSGTMNAVYIAQQPGSDQAVMLTAFIIPPTLSPKARDLFRKRFAQEAIALARLTHPHILPLSDFGEQFGYPYFVTPQVTAGSVAQRLKEQSRFTPMQTLAILKPVADALDYAHSKGVVHGSLKPVNFILDASQNIQIAGFGLTCMLALRDLEQSALPYGHLLNVMGTFLGTAEYIAPEVVQGAPVAVSADLYALGITLFELLSGKPPFTGTDPFEVAKMHLVQPLPSIQVVCPDLPIALDMVLQSALECDPTRRVASATQLATTFERVLHLTDVAKQAPSVGPIGQTEPKTPTDITLPPTVNWFDEGEFSKSGKWQVATPTAAKDSEQVDTSKALTLQNTTTNSAVETSDALWASQESPSHAQASESMVTTHEHTIDPFVWWSATAQSSLDATDPKNGVDGPMTSMRLASHRGSHPDVRYQRTRAGASSLPWSRQEVSLQLWVEVASA
jgi:serine/threonine-protein kinase